MERPDLRSYAAIEPKIYAYQTPGVARHVGWTKIGEARKQTVAARSAQQTGTVGVEARLCWVRPARFADGRDLRDTMFHHYLERKGVVREQNPRREWFRIGGEEALGHFEVFSGQEGEEAAQGRMEYVLRNEQAEAVRLARLHFEDGGEKFLWNAKPRFGKTLAAYDLVRQMGARKVLVLTNRPAVSDGWLTDFLRFIAWQEPLLFVSENAALRQAHPEGVYSREDYLNALSRRDDVEGFVAFESLQGLKGAQAFGGRHEKLRWLRDLEFDLLIIDEAHEGAETEKATFAIEVLRHRHRLHLSGTPFRQLADGAFWADEVFSWSYVDEQEAKAAWAGEENNPYEMLPRMRMFTYRLSPMVEATVRRGFDETHDYAFDLAEFFKVERDRFVYEAQVRAFLQALTTQEKYPFSTPALRRELCHTLWVLNRVASAKALKALLKEPGSGFEEYDVVLAAGDGKGNDEDAVISESALTRVRTAIKSSGRPTITLSVGQLTVGVTVPEWTGILMLNTCKSAAAYFQATFRVQNPHETVRDGKLWMKEEAYVFDFDPTRTLELFAELANQLAPQIETGAPNEAERAACIRRLLNFYPVIGEDEEGRMAPLDVGQVLSIPRRLRCQEVVRSGFMSNFLFRVGNVFRKVEAYRAILEKLPVAEDFHANRKQTQAVTLADVPLDEEGEVAIPREMAVGTARELFGNKLYAIEPAPPATLAETAPEAYGQAVVAANAETIGAMVRMASAQMGLKPRAAKALENRLKEGLAQEIRKVEAEAKRRVLDEENAHAQAMSAAGAAERAALQAAHEETLATLEEKRREALQRAGAAFMEATPTEVAHQALTAQAQERKKSNEEAVRERLRGFARTIPSFLMAYGDDGLTLANFDTYVEPEAFEEVTGITLEEFRLLRDGGERDGEHMEGGLFDERVFNDSVKAFLRKKRELADYFAPAHDEDIFDYIPPQRTNQIFTPRRVVLQMVDALERENPGCFDDPGHTFADLHTKSGMFLAEIAKRLFRSAGMRRRFPDDKARLAHIFTRQLYAMAPTRLIHLIVLEYLLGFDECLRGQAEAHIVQADSAKAAQEGRLQKLVAKHFG